MVWPIPALIQNIPYSRSLCMHPDCNIPGQAPATLQPGFRIIKAAKTSTLLIQQQIAPLHILILQSFTAGELGQGHGEMGMALIGEASLLRLFGGLGLGLGLGLGFDLIFLSLPSHIELVNCAISSSHQSQISREGTHQLRDALIQSSSRSKYLAFIGNISHKEESNVRITCAFLPAFLSFNSA